MFCHCILFNALLHCYSLLLRKLIVTEPQNKACVFASKSSKGSKSSPATSMVLTNITMAVDLCTDGEGNT